MTVAVAAVAVVVLVASAALFLVGIARHRRVFRAPAPYRWPSVLKLERAGSGRAMSGLLDQLGGPGRQAFRQALRIDGRMIVPGYAVFLCVLCLVSIAAVRAASSGGIEAVGVAAACLAALLALVAGGLDLVENRALGQVLDAWQDIPIPERPARDEAAQRQHMRRQQVAAIDGPSRRAAAACSWKLRLIGLVLVWLLVAGVVALTHVLGDRSDDHRDGCRGGHAHGHVIGQGHHRQVLGRSGALGPKPERHHRDCSSDGSRRPER